MSARARSARVRRARALQIVEQRDPGGVPDDPGGEVPEAASARCRPSPDGTPPTPASEPPAAPTSPEIPGHPRCAPGRAGCFRTAPLLWRAVTTDVVTMDKIVCPLQAARPHLPRVRDLRRDRQHLRLRALRRSAEEQRRERLVEGDDPGARRHRGARLRDHPAPAHLGGVGPPGGLHRSARGLPRCKRRFRADHLEEVRNGTARARGHPLREGALEAARATTRTAT